MRRIVVERVEVVVDVLHLGALGDVEPEADEHILDLAPGLGDQVQSTDRRQRIGRQRHIDAVLLEPCVQLGHRELTRR